MKEMIGGTMQRVVRFVMSNWGNEMAVRWITNIMVSVHVGLGTAVMAGGTEVFFPPAYKPLVNIVNGNLWVWGVWIMIAAALMFVPTRWPQIIGLWLGMFWQIMWSVAFAIAMIKFGGAGSIEAVAFGGFALIDAALLTARIVERDGR